MGLTNFPNGLTSFGFPVMPAGGIAPGGSIFFLNPSHPNASDGNGGVGIGAGPDTPMATLAGVYAKMTAGVHDTCFYIPGATSLNLTATLTWAKDYTHLIGMGAPTRSSPRARIFQHADATALSPLVNVTATGCNIRNIEIFQGVDDADSLINLQVTGGRNHFWNVHFAGGGHATMAIDNCASLFVNGGEENTFERCKLGLTTIPLATGGNVLRFDGSAKENLFIDCVLGTMISNAGARLVELVDGAAVDQFNWFFNTKFNSNSANKATTMASAFEIPSGHTTTATLYLDKDCGGMGFADWDDDDRGIIYLEAGAITAGGNAGIAQVSAAT